MTEPTRWEANPTPPAPNPIEAPTGNLWIDLKNALKKIFGR